MFCEDFDKFSEVYTVMGGRRGNGAIYFMTSRNANLRAKLEVANAKIAELEKKVIKRQIQDRIGEWEFRERIYSKMEDAIKKKRRM